MSFNAKMKDLDSFSYHAGISKQKGKAPFSNKRLHPQGHLQKTSYYLPSCRVCQKNGTGLHYGVITCEACKGFFRRNSKAPHLLRCLKNDSCAITLYNGPFCSKCRFQKCIEVGMSEKAVKKGRYTTQRKTQYILEVGKQKGTSEKESANKQSYQHPCAFSGSLPENDVFTQNILTAHKTHVPSMHYLTEPNVDEMFWQYHSKNDVYISLVELLNSAEDNLNSSDQIHHIQWEVTVDLDAKLRWYISFFNNVPGFKELTASDQAELLKQAHFEFIFLEGFSGYNNETKLVCPSINKCLHMDDLSRVYGKPFMTELFTLAQSLKRMNISLPEIILTEVMCVLSSDRCQLQEPKKVEFLQSQTVDALIHYLKCTCPSPMLRFAKIMDRVTAMRTLTEWNRNLVKSFCDWPYVQENALLFEVFNL